MKLRDADPSGKQNFFNFKTGRIAAALMLCGLIAAANTTGHHPRSDVVEDPIEHIFSPELAEVSGGAKNVATHLAKKIIDQSKSGGKDKEVQVVELLGEPGQFQVSVIKTVNTQAEGDYGQYRLSATMSKNAEGELDPNTATIVFLGMYMGSYNETKLSGYGRLYGFMFSNLNETHVGTRGWLLVTNKAIEGKVEEQVQFYEYLADPKGLEAVIGSQKVKALDSITFADNLYYANRILERSALGSPVDFTRNLGSYIGTTTTTTSTIPGPTPSYSFTTSTSAFYTSQSTRP